MNSPFLVLTKYVYAKRQDGGAFCPGAIEAKENENSYIVSFLDRTRSTVHEDDLVWLGFYSLLPENWPTSAQIQPVKFPKQEGGSIFYDGAVKMEVEDFASPRPESLRLLKNAKECRLNYDEVPERFDEARICSNEQCKITKTKDKMEDFDAIANDADRICSRQRRSSVLRLNRKALSKEISQNNGTEDSSKTERKVRGDEEDLLTAYKDGEGSRRHILNPSYHQRSPYHPYERYDPPYLGTPCLTPPSTPGSLPPPLYACKPYDTPAFAGDMWSHMDTRDNGGGIRRRRDNMKKCRKVYGIENKDLWCTQCKWKKACTRFQMGNYNQKHF